MDVHALLGPIAGVSMDWILLGGCVLGLTLDAMRGGTSRATALTLAISITLLLSTYIEKAFFFSTLGETLSTPLSQGLLILGLFVVLFIFMYRIIDSFGFDGQGAFPAFLAGLAATAVLTVFWLQTPILDSVWHFGPQIQGIFAEAYRFWWLMAAYLALAAARG